MPTTGSAHQNAFARRGPAALLPCTPAARRWTAVAAVALIVALVASAADGIARRDASGPAAALSLALAGALAIFVRRRRHERSPDDGPGTDAADRDGRYRAVFEASPLPMLVLDESTHAIVEANAAACALYGYDRASFRRLCLRDLRAQPDVAALSAELGPANGEDRDKRWRHRRRDGTTFVAEVATARVQFGGAGARVAFVEDVSARVREEEQLTASALAFENVSEAVAVLDPRGRIVSINQSFVRLTGFPPADVLGRSASILVHGSPRLVRQAVSSAGRADGEMWLRRRDGPPFLVALSVNAVRQGGGRATHVVAVARDMTAEKAAEARIHALAYYDSLTGLPNRNLLEDRVRQMIALHERSRESFALLMVDLDHFKQVNDTLGHVAGDALLQTAAARIDGAVREADTAARWGGDEFVLLLPATSRDGAGAIAQRIQQAMAAPATIEGRLVALGASIGIATYPKDGRDFEALLRKAGGAMQRAKDIGRNTFQFYEELPHGEARERVAIAGALRAALDGGSQIRVHYQPLLDLRTKRVTGFEALMRWHHPELGEVPPQKFVRIAETNGYMGSLGLFVLRQACLQLRALDLAGMHEARMAVNVSVAQLHDGRFAQRCLAILRETGVAPARLELEVTETVMLQDQAPVLEQLHELRGQGVGIAIDDFGTGYSSLAYLRALPISTIKIDRSFVADMQRDRGAASIVEVIVGLAHTLQHAVVAEGVETEGQREALEVLSCDQAQGFLFGEPMPPEGLFDWLLSRHALPRS